MGGSYLSQPEYMQDNVLQQRKDSESFANRLSDADIDVQSRFYPANRDKSPDVNSWGPGQGSHPDEIESRNLLGHTGNGWACLDIDHAGPLPEAVHELLDNNPTFHVRSPHSDHPIEGHHHFQIPEYSGKNSFDWGELKHGTLVMTPGSEITDCKHDCCTPESPGRYKIESNRPLVKICQSDIPDLFTTDTSNPDSNVDFDTHPTDDDGPVFNPGSRLEYGQEHSDKLDTMATWAREGGEPPEIAYPDDRSKSECYLAWLLAYWFERNPIAVRHIMNRLNPPKWAQRGDEYREGVLKAVEKQPDTVEYIGTGESGPSEELVCSIWIDLYSDGPMSTEEVAETAGYGERQTRKALDWLDERNYIDYQREGRSGNWVANQEQDPLDESEKELNSIETMGEYLK